MGTSFAFVSTNAFQLEESILVLINMHFRSIRSRLFGKYGRSNNRFIL